MNSVYFLSDSRNGFFTKLALDLKKNMKKGSNLVIISANPNDDVKSAKKKKVLVKQFESVGIKFKETHIITYSTKDINEKIDNADVLFLHGGNPILQFEFIESCNLISKIKEFEGIIMGVSAGSINLSKTSFLPPLKDLEEYKDFNIYQGINICDINIFPHFNINSLNDKELYMCEEEVCTMKDLLYCLNKAGKAYCLPDKCTLKVENKEITILDDDCYLYDNNKFIKLNKEK